MPCGPSVFQCGSPALWRRQHLPNFSGLFRWRRRAVPRAFGVLVDHLPSSILRLPAFVSRSPPDNSCMYPSWISRSLCSAGIVRCIKPLAQSRNETNSSWVNGADKSGFIFQICASGAAVQASHPATIKLTHYRLAPSLDFLNAKH